MPILRRFFQNNHRSTILLIILATRPHKMTMCVGYSFFWFFLELSVSCSSFCHDLALLSWNPTDLPRSFLRTNVDQCNFSFVLGCLGLMYMENHTCKFLSEDDALTVIFWRNPNSKPPQIYPHRFLRTSVDQCNFSFFFGLFRPYVHGKSHMQVFEWIRRSDGYFPAKP